MGVTFRSVMIGLLLIPLNNFWVVLSEIVWYSGEPTTISLFYNVVFLVFVVILINLLVERIRPSWALKPAEILVIYVMLGISSALCGHDMIEILVSTMAFLHRYAPIEHRYTEVLKYAPSWLMVTDPTALASAYVGQESMYTWANLQPWLKPLSFWFSFIMALCAVLWGLNLILRKQWTENEKLSYPIIQVPMMLATEPKSLFRNRLFWLAFIIAGTIDLVNGFNALFPMLPKIPVVHIVNVQSLFAERPWTDMGETWISLYPFAIGMCFFMPTDLAFSCWFFYWFWKAQRVFASYIGMHGMPGFPFVAEQTVGGYYAVALIALWVTRHHFKRCGRILMGLPVERETASERWEVRIAVAMIMGGFGYLVLFCRWTHMSFPIIIVFFVLYFLLSIAVTRMRAELGPPAHDLGAIGPQIEILNFLGMSNMARNYPSDMTMFGFLNFFNRAYRGHPMPVGMEGFRIAERLKMRNLRLLAAMWVATAAGTISAFWAMIWALDKYGAAAKMVGPGELFGRETWEKVNTWFTAPTVHQYEPTYAILIGLAVALILGALRMNLTWWPFHPVGYAVSGSWSMDQLWVCVFVAWLVKALMLKYGGVKTYKPAVPFFVGLIMGDFVVGSCWNLYGIITQQQVYHFWPY